MAKISTNKASKSGKSVKTDSNDNKSIANTETNPNYSIRQISNGWLVSKSWSDKNGKYHSEEVYHEEKPEGLDSIVDEDESEEEEDD